MRVEALRSERRGECVRLSMRLVWEDRERPDDVVWLEWDGSAAEYAEPSADAALLVAYPMAMSAGERRVSVDGDVCPRLADGSRTAAAAIASWNPGVRAPALELSERAAMPDPEGASRAALCLSGGVDALTLLQENRRTVPAGHPASFGNAVLAFGLNTYDFEAGAPRTERLAAFEEHRARLGALCESAGLSLHVVRTNLRALYPDWDTWSRFAHGTPLAAFGHTLARRIRSLAIAGEGSALFAGLWSNPLLDAFYSSHALDVHGMHAALPRIEKVRRLAEWPEGLAALRVCLMIDLPDAGESNCGRCEKCVRTMLSLLAVGALDRAPFPRREISSSDIERLTIGPVGGTVFLAECVPGLEQRGHAELARAVRARLARHEAERAGREAERAASWWRRRPRA